MCLYFQLFVPFLLAIVLSVPLRYMNYDYPLGIFKLFLCYIYIICVCLLIVVSNIYFVCFVWSVFVLCLVHCVPNAASVSGLSILNCPFGLLNRLSEIALERVFVLDFFVLCTICCQFLLITHYWLPLRYSLTFICPIILYRVHLTMTHTELNISNTNTNVNINLIFISFAILTCV